MFLYLYPYLYLYLKIYVYNICILCIHIIYIYAHIYIYTYIYICTYIYIYICIYIYIYIVPLLLAVFACNPRCGISLLQTSAEPSTGGESSFLQGKVATFFDGPTEPIFCISIPAEKTIKVFRIKQSLKRHNSRHTRDDLL